MCIGFWISINTKYWHFCSQWFRLHQVRPKVQIKCRTLGRGVGMHENPPSTIGAQSLGPGPAVAWQAASLLGSRTMCFHPVVWGLHCVPARACLGVGILRVMRLHGGSSAAPKWEPLLPCSTQSWALTPFVWLLRHVGNLFKRALWSSGVTAAPVCRADSVAQLFLEMISLGFLLLTLSKCLIAWNLIQENS